MEFLSTVQFKRPGLYTGVSSRKMFRSSPYKAFAVKMYKQSAHMESFKPTLSQKPSTIGSPKGK